MRTLVRPFVVLLLSLVLPSPLLAASSSQDGDPAAGSNVLAASALLAVDQNRATIVERIVNEWSDRLTAMPGGVSRAQLKEMLAAMRADQLLAASLAGSLDGLKAIVVAATPGSGKARIADAGGIVPSALGDANADLVYTPVSPCRLFDTRVTQSGKGTPTPGVVRTYGAVTPVAQQGGPGNCAAGAGATVALIQIGALTPSGNGLLQAGPQGATSFPNALILYQPGDQYGATVAMPLNPANGQFDLLEQFAAADLYGDLLGYFKPATGAFVQGGNTFGATAKLGTKDNNAVEIYANGARVMRYEPGATSPNVIGGHPNNGADGASFGQTVAGGGNVGTTCFDPSGGFRSCGNQAAGNYSSIGGGIANRASDNSATIAGGSNNNASGVVSTVGGGSGNNAFGPAATVGGGSSNQASGFAATVGGGQTNTASGDGSTVGGGNSNVASGPAATIGGGRNNTASGSFSFAAGRRAKATTTGSFMWADSNDFDFQPSVANFFGVRATGGVGLTVAINPSTGAVTQFCNLLPGVPSWQCTSDRDAKENFATVDGQEILKRLEAMPITTWNFKGADPTARALGPTAQDFYAAFHLGNDDKTIATSHLATVGLAAIQGLNAKLEARLAEQASVIETQRSGLAAQAAEIAELRRAVEVLLARTLSDSRVAQAR